MTCSFRLGRSTIAGRPKTFVRGACELDESSPDRVPPTGAVDGLLRLETLTRRRSPARAERAKGRAQRGLLRPSRGLDGNAEDVGLELHEPAVARHAAARANQLEGRHRLEYI